MLSSKGSASGEVMAKRLPEDVYQSLRKSVEQGKEIDPSIADTVAGAMKD